MDLHLADEGQEFCHEEEGGKIYYHEALPPQFEKIYSKHTYQVEGTKKRSVNSSLARADLFKKFVTRWDGVQVNGQPLTQEASVTRMGRTFCGAEIFVLFETLSNKLAAKITNNKEMLAIYEEAESEPPFGS